MAIDFPSSPTDGQTLTSGTTKWVYSSTTGKWNIAAPDSPTTTAFAPIGTVVSYMGSSAPNGWLLCNGASLTRSSYPALFAVIVTTYGGGSNPGTTFALPQFVGTTGIYVIRATDEAVTLSGATNLLAMPVGTMSLFAMSSIPSGWLRCDGSAVSRTGYADLYSAVGTTYGTGDASTTFNLPNMASSGSGSPVYYIKGILSGDTAPATVAHASTHTRTGSDIVDGDQLQVDYVPASYTRNSAATGAGAVTDLAAHLSGLDTGKVSVGATAGGGLTGTYPNPSIAAPIMFSAYGLTNYSVASGTDFLFNTVVVNVGSGYNSATGRFTAPVDGYYMFHYSFLSVASASVVDTRLRVNGSTLLAAAYSGDGVSSYKSGGASAGTFLTAGQYVSVLAFGIAYCHPDAAHQVFCGSRVK